MPRILVVEPDSHVAGRIAAALRAEEWDVLRVTGPESMTQAVAQQEVHAVVVGPGIDTAVHVLSALQDDLPEGTAVTLVTGDPSPLAGSRMPAFEVVAPDAEPEELVAAVRRGLNVRPHEGPRVTGGREVSSADLFADLLNSMDNAGTPGASSAAPPAAARRPPRRAAGVDEEVDRVLEETLSGTRPGVPRRRARRPAAAADQAVEDLLRRALTETGAAPKAPVAGAEAAGPQPFGSYELLERIALGGMAEVWRARMRGVEGFERIVAIKKILPHLTDNDDFSDMFVDEAKLAAQLNHENIIHIYDFGVLDGQYYLVMEYVQGADLRTLLNAARHRVQTVPIGLALLVGSRLAGALDYAHRRKGPNDRELGLVHRDVSPQNVLVGLEGEIKLCDFGIATAVSKVSKTQMGALKGKLQYMSPEQARGEAVDARSDVFSLGVLLFEMLTGQRLFTGDGELAILDAVRECRVPAPRTLRPDLPLEVDEAVRRALAKDPAKRFQTAGQMHDALASCIAQLQPVPGANDLAHFVRRLLQSDEAPPPPAVPRHPGTEPVGDPLAAVLSGSGSAGLRRLPWPALWGGLAAVGLAAVLLGVWMIGRGGGDGVEGPVPAATAEEDEPASAGPTGATPATEPTLAAPEDLAPTEELAANEPAGEPDPSSPDELVEEAVARREQELRSRFQQQQRALLAEIEAVNRQAALAAELDAEEVAEPGPNVQPPRLVAPLTPRWPLGVSDAPDGSQVEVSVLVDESGGVEAVRLISGLAPELGVNEAVLAAAREARFRPAVQDGEAAKMWYKLVVPVRP